MKVKSISGIALASNWCLFVVLAIILPMESAAQKSVSDSLYRRLSAAKSAATKLGIYEALIREFQGADPAKAQTIIAELDSVATRENIAEGRALADYYRGVHHLLKGKYDSLNYYAQSAVRKSSEQRVRRTKAMGLNLRAVYFWHIGQMDSSVSYHLEALRLRERINDQAGMGVSYLGLGGLYVSLDKLTEAEQLLKRAVDIGRSTNNERLIVNAMHFLANIYSKQRKYEQALETDTAALEIAIRLNNKRVISQIYSNMASCFVETRRPRTALIYYHKVLKIDRFFKDDKQIGDTYSNIAGVYLKTGDYRQAIEIGLQAVGLFKKTGYKEGLNHVYPILSTSYAKRGEYQKAFENEREYNSLKGDLFNENSHRTIARLKTEYETEKKEQQVLSLKQQNEIQHLEIELKNILIGVAGGLLVILIILGRVISSRRKLRSRIELQEEVSRQQILAAQAVINAEERERGRIAADLHDGLGQLLSASLLNLKLLFERLALNEENKERAEQAISLLSNSYDEMRSISQQLMPEVVIRKGLILAVLGLAERSSHEGFSIHVDSHSDEYALDREQEVVIYRIIQEVVNNAHKHSGADQLSIQFNSDLRGTTISLEDNGIGFDINMEKQGLGLSNIRSRVDYLGGTLDLDSSPGKGTLTILFIPPRNMQGMSLNSAPSI
jgi:two-component system NarL family sensor kinase